MGKEGDLWDDSALINAFDNAISSYKKSHYNSENKGISTKKEPEILTNTRYDEDTINIPVTDSSETSYVLKLEENHQPCLDSTNSQEIQNVDNGYSYEQGVDDYNQLVAQYYELEEKRLKLLDQINRYTATASNSGVQYCNAQDYSVYAHQVSDPNVACSCCPCFSQCDLASCTSVPGCSAVGSHADKTCNHDNVENDHKMVITREDGKIREMAMGAAERALSTIKTTFSGDFNVNEEKERKNSKPEQIGDSETDLTAVLNAWYSAGFYTGKYLAEQSAGNKRQG